MDDHDVRQIATMPQRRARSLMLLLVGGECRLVYDDVFDLGAHELI